MSLPNLSDADIKKLKEVIDEGCKIKYDVQTLNEGLRETVKAIAEETDVPVKVINKAIRTAFKEDFHDQKNEMGDLEELLGVVKKN